MRFTPYRLFFCLIGILLTTPAWATTYVLVPDEDLADQAALIVEATVEAMTPAAGRVPATEYRMRVERVIKGTAPSVVAVRVPGGIGQRGWAVKLWGMPHFENGERTLLFLGRSADGTYQPLHLLLGVFRQVEVAGERLWLRSLAGAREIEAPGLQSTTARARSRLPKNAERFTGWLADRAAGNIRVPDYAATLPAREGLRELTDPFSLFDFGGLFIRWFEFDTGAPVEWHFFAGGQAGVPGGGQAEFINALNAWNADPRTQINYVFGGTTTASGGFSDEGDGLNTILFNDPTGFFREPFNCLSGGILAAGGPRFIPDNTGPFRGEEAIRTLESEIIVNRNVACFFEGSPNPSAAAEQLFGHELGHTLGIGHSCGDSGSAFPFCGDTPILDDALMRAIFHDDDRRADLNPDDLAAARFLYQGALAGGCQSSSTALCLNGGRFLVEVGWATANNSGTGFVVPFQADDSGLFWFFAPDNWEILVKAIDACGAFDRFWVFAAATTNVEYLMTVTDTETGELQPYFKELGPPAPAITDTDAFATCP